MGVFFYSKKIAWPAAVEWPAPNQRADRMPVYVAVPEKEIAVEMPIQEIMKLRKIKTDGKFCIRFHRVKDIHMCCISQADESQADRLMKFADEFYHLAVFGRQLESVGRLSMDEVFIVDVVNKRYNVILSMKEAENGNDEWSPYYCISLQKKSKH